MSRLCLPVRTTLPVIVLLLQVLTVSGLFADAIIITQAMNASTVCEIFVEDLHYSADH